MYEGQTYDVILSRMLKKALEKNGSLDSREGSLLWYGQAPAAVELQNLYIALDNVLQESFADTATRPYLILRAAERGIRPFEASPAVLKLTVLPKELELPMGTRFSVGELNYYVSERLEDGYAATCETPGTAGNDCGGDVIPIEYIKGLESCSVAALLVPGEDEEDTESLRKRYFASLEDQAFGGNMADYTRVAAAIPGVGAVKVYREWNGGLKPSRFVPPKGAGEWIAGLSDAPEGVKPWLEALYEAADRNMFTVGGTVRIVISDSTGAVPSDTLINEVQTAIDPLQNAGEGAGLAPIGHVVQVVGVRPVKVNISLSLSYQSGYDWSRVKAQAEEAVKEYLGELADAWGEDSEPVVVRVSQIESRMLDVAGVLDVSGAEINGSGGNLVLDEDSIPVLGGITAGIMG